MMPEDYFKKNIELWEQFTTSYMDTMFRMVGKTMDQSQSPISRANPPIPTANPFAWGKTQP